MKAWTFFPAVRPHVHAFIPQPCNRIWYHMRRGRWPAPAVKHVYREGRAVGALLLFLTVVPKRIETASKDVRQPQDGQEILTL